MAGTGDEKQLKRCVTAIIEAVQESITKLQPQQQTSNPDTLLTNSTLNYNINTFTVNVEEDELIDTLTTRIESILNQYIPYLTQTCQKYLLHFLHQYHYDQDERKFNDSLTLNDLHPFLRELQGVLASVDAFLAAWEGKLSSVRDFIKAYPTFKDKPGLWGTTLLYSTAKNNHMSLVEYLVTSAHCSVNTQNQQHLEKALSASIITAKDFTVSPTAASTALHGACFNGHLEIVKYLIKHGADYFIKNHAQETPIMNGESRPEIKQFFQDFLIPGYSRSLNNFPDEPILEEPILARSGQQEVDCVWEYKPFLDQKWFKFPASESSEIHQSLIVAPDQQFKSEVHLRVRQGVYSVSTIQFIRSGKDLDQQNLAWVRCRGSSILNFDIYSLWQMMFMKHPQADQSASPSLKNFDIPTIYDSEFKIQLNSWYNCDAKTNSRLDHAMNYRQKIIPLDLDFITDDEVKFNLHEFTFTNDQKSVLGFIRWIPKLISNNEQNKNKITNIDNFQTLTNLNPIPLTRRHLNEVLQASNTSTTEEQLTEDINEDDSTLQSMSNEDDDTDTLENRNKTTQSSDSGIWSISDSTNNDDTVPFNTVSTLQQQTVLTTTSKITTDGKSDDSLSDLKINDYFNETVAMARPAQQSSLLERSDSSLNLQATAALTAQLEEENKELKAKLAAETASVQEQLNLNVQRTAEQERRLAEAMEEIDRMHTEQKKMEEKEAKIQQIAKTIKTIEYNNIPTQIIHDFITPKFNLVLDWLRKTKKLDEFFYDKIPKMTFREQNNTYTVTISGFQVHHDSFKAVLNRISTLSNVTQSAKDFYQRHLNRLTRAITNALFQVNSRTRNWRNYAKCLVQLLQEKNTEHSKLFNDYINQKSKILTEQSISDSSTKPWIELKTQTNNFMKQYPFVNEIETLKHQALEEFIKQNISFQRLKLDKKPTEKSISVVKDFIEKVKAVFKTNAEYTGHELKHFSLIPELLQRIMIYYCCFLIQLPLYESAKELLEKIEKNTVITIATSTGSGKSTLLPALLIAEGYDKVIVTQPRRLPCTLISKRVNETMRTETGSLSEKLAGWAVSGAQGNPKAKILYLTDGLLKERLLYDENFITTQTRLNKSIVFFIDEVHERSVNIDLCLALLARLLSLKPELKSKLKVIISSATLDASVPTLYRNIQQLRFDEFTMPAMGTLHTVIKLPRPNENIVDIVLELCKKRQRHDQILCFVNSVSDVNQCCRLLAEISRGTIIAYPLIQSQSSAVQQQNIEHGSIFFSTTVAETSLTFPSLKYVVDTGMINIPVYDLQSKQTVLKEVRAAESTIKQRLGRLGRTKPGEYYSLYDFKVEDKRFPTPQICQSDLMNIEFSLRKSPLKNGLNYLAAFLPDKPSPQAINMTVNELRKLNILEGHSDQFTNHGKSLAKLPDFGSLAMSKSVLAALRDYSSGRDLICLSSILSVLNTTALLKALPQNLKSPEGDFMTLLNVMNAILLVKQSVQAQQFNLERVCQAKGLLGIKHILGQALRRYTSLEKSFNLSNDFRERAQVKSDNWEFIAKALLAGYSDNVFVSMKELQGRIHRFSRYKDTTDIAVLDLQSTLTRPISLAPVSLVLARDIRYSTAIRSTAVLSFVGEIKPVWIEYNLERKVTLNNEEETKLNSNNIFSNALSTFSHKINMQLSNQTLSLKGPSGVVLNAELHLRQQMVTELKFELKNANPPNTTLHTNLSRNLESVMKMTRIFNPMKWRWEAQKQVKITINSNTATKICEITVEGRDSENQKVKNEFDSFLTWLQNCAVIRHPNAGVSPRILRPQMRKTCLDIEERISHVTDSKRTLVDLWNGVKGSKATRETRMEVVAWIALCKFDCKLEGGFVRDWVVGNYTAPPATLRTNPKGWIEYQTNSKKDLIPYMNREVIPADLDCHLPSHAYFDIDKFQDELHKFDMKCKVFREDWRYVLLLDEDAKTGPFTMDLIEPHVALTHDRIDFDVNNLSLEKDYTHELGMRVDIQQKPYAIELETIVDNIKNKRFQVLRPIDKHMNDRINKMTNIRHWTQLGQPFSFIPQPLPKYYAVLVPLPSSSNLYQGLVTQMRTIGTIQIVAIEQIKNPLLEDAYEAMKKLIAKQCKGFNPNERELFHGTKDDGINGITEDGFDDRFFNPKGAWGHGAYFADDPRKSHAYTAPDATDQTRVMYYNKVLLGVESMMTAVDQTLVSAPRGFHCVHGTGFQYHEYIVYRYGQALPYLKIIYKG